MKKIIATQNDSGQRLDKFLTKLLKDAPMGMIYKWIRKKRVKINGKKAEPSYMIKDGDVLELYINDEFFSVPNHTRKGASKPVIVYQDKNIVVLDKPSGVASHGEEDSLLDRITNHLIETGEFDPNTEHTFSPALCNRLDKNTSGLVIAAKNAEALREINNKIKLREIEKYYVLKTEKPPIPSQGVIEGYTLKNEKERKVYFYKDAVPGAKHSKTLYRTLDKEGTVEVQLITGRTHQIRASFAYIGSPLVGDVKYGASKNGKKDFQMLRSYKLVFNFKTPSGELDYLNGKVIQTNFNF
ncbi:MAG: RluA family pseudouridine synthase [Clostridia bacterium]|nr:RluA family pseudouridine synthase [Clostridia bacterium]MBQ9737852.1 RluA family pseudouridine synthase [Clostridia bacterium]